MLILLNQPEKVLNSLVISKSPDLKIKKKDDQLLIVNTETGLWSILDPQFQSFFSRLDKPIFYSELIKNDQGIPPAMYISFLEETYKKGIVNISGRKSESIQSERVNRDEETSTLIFEVEKGEKTFIEKIESYVSSLIHDGSKDRIIVRFTGNTVSLAGVFEDIEHKLFSMAKHNERDLQISADYFPGIDKSHYQGFQVSADFRCRAEDLLSGSGFPDEMRADKTQVEENRVRKSVTVMVNSGEQFKPVFSLLLNNEVNNIALKIDPEVYLNNNAITASIRKMEEMAAAYLETIDYAYSQTSGSRTRLIFADAHRFLSNVYGKGIEHPCSGSPCSMGCKTKVIKESGGIFACKSLSEKTAEKLRISQQDLDCPAQSETLKFWRTNRIETSPACKRCMWKKLCFGGCPVITYEKYGSLNREDPRCQFFRMIYENIIWKVHKTPLIVRKLGGHNS
ncbi:MAG: SPASM domain-containing protein [Firmicutes bacterium]|nr:SPASM domain-containing protein [Bacillota bacterium]